MVSCYLQGGLSNQLFQIAATYCYAKKYNDIAIFNFNECHTSNQGYTSLKYKDNLFKNLNHQTNIVIDNIYIEKNHFYEEIPNLPNLQLQGYFQSEKYFNNYFDDVKKLFFFDEKQETEIKNFLKSIDNIDNIVSIHIRRGDYLRFPLIHPTCTIEYFTEAMSFFPNHTFIVVSDDKDWVKLNFNSKNIVLSPFDNEINDLLLIKNSYNNILSNSSFSWWGAWLNSNENKKIIAPKKWFGLGLQNWKIEDRIPEQWITI